MTLHFARVRTAARLAGLMLALLVPAACTSDPGRDVVPMSNPLETDAAPSGPAEIIPIEEVRKSQAAAVAQRIANTEIVVTYSRPAARGRELFGALVPYDAVWNPGADQATAVAISRDIQVNGRPLSAGRYSLWAIPGAERWAIIFNRAADVYHTPYPGADQDALRLEVVPRSGPHAELLTFSFPMVEGKDAELQLHWGEVQVPMTVRVP